MRMGRQHVRDGLIHVRQSKTGTTLAIPIHPELRAVLDATPAEHLTFLTTAGPPGVSHSTRTASPTGSSASVGGLDCRLAPPCMGYGRPPVEGSPTWDAARP